MWIERDTLNSEHKDIELNDLLSKIRIPKTPANTKTTNNEFLIGIVKTVELEDSRFPFKGYRQKSELYKITFEKFKYYELFKQVLNQLNKCIQDANDAFKNYFKDVLGFLDAEQKTHSNLFKMAEDDKAQNYVMKL